jgi:hypothetical protein
MSGCVVAWKSSRVGIWPLSADRVRGGRALDPAGFKPAARSF